ncbi:hypothetical protein NKG94_33770 [Micromonospora sp. M12]
MSGRAGAPSRAGSLVVLLEGGPAAVTERAERLVGLLHGEATIAHSAPTWWRRYRSLPATRRCAWRCRSATCTPPSTRSATRPARRCRCAGPPGWAWCTRHFRERWHPTGWRPSWPPSEGAAGPAGSLRGGLRSGGGPPGCRSLGRAGRPGPAASREETSRSGAPTRPGRLPGGL